MKYFNIDAAVLFQVYIFARNILCCIYVECTVGEVEDGTIKVLFIRIYSNFAVSRCIVKAKK